MCKKIVNWSIFSCLKILHECLDDEKDNHPQIGPAASTKYRNRRISGDSVGSQTHTNIYNSKRTSTISDNDKLNLSIIEQVEEAVIESIRVSKISSKLTMTEIKQTFFFFFTMKWYAIVGYLPVHHWENATFTRHDQYCNKAAKSYHISTTSFVRLERGLYGIG